MPCGKIGKVLLGGDCMKVIGFLRTMANHINTINNEAMKCSLPELISYVKSKSGNLAEGGAEGMKVFMRYWFILRLLNANARRQPCFFKSMILLAYETSFGNDIEVNVGISAGERHFSEGHCWLSKNGTLFRDNNDMAAELFTERIGENAGIIYWMRGAIQTKKTLFKKSASKINEIHYDL